MTTTHAFTMHTDLLRSVIKKQAGTLSKAVLEGVMNSIDAGATRVDVLLGTSQLHITDDGKGFKDKTEIELFFATFGQPHKEGDATYGQFRMGRGQMFAFGINTWRTGSFQMYVDIEQNLGFDLIENLPLKNGCDIIIDLYEHLSVQDIYYLEREIERYVKYTGIPIFVNDRQVNVVVDPAKFPESNDVAYIKLSSSGSLDIYNQGVLVESIGQWKYGVGGVVISKIKMAVNFARNQVLVKECPVWKTVQPLINKQGESEVTTKHTLNDAERENIITRIVTNQIGRHGSILQTAKVFVDITGKAWSANAIRRANFLYFSVAKRHDLIGDKLIQGGTALVLDEEWTAKFECDIKDIFKLFTTYTPLPSFRTISELSNDLSVEFVELKPSSYTTKDKIWVRIIETMYHEWRREKENWNTPRHKILIGNSTTSLAWTDGATMICFDKKFLGGLPIMDRGIVNMKSMTEIGQTLIHELCHNNDSREGIHLPDFYQEYHDTTLKFLPVMLMGIMRYMTPAKYCNLKEKFQGKNTVDDLDVEEIEINEERGVLVAQSAQNFSHL